MNLVYFLTIGTLLSVILGEFGHYPFGASGVAVSLTDIFLTLTLIIFLIWKIGIKKELIEVKKFKWLFLFWLTGFISVIVSGIFGGGLYLLRYLIYSSSLILGFYLIKSKVASVSRIIDVSLIVGLFLSGIGFLQLIFYPNLDALVAFGYDPHQGRLVSSFLDPNFIGAFLNIFVILSLYNFQKNHLRKYLVFSGIFILAVVLTFSRSAYLMLAVEILIYGLKSYKKLVAILVVLFLVLFLLFPKFNQRIVGGLTLDASATERIQSWNNGLILFRENPVTGVGFDNLRYQFERHDLLKVFSENGGHSGAGVDSSLVFVLATEGILGLLSFLIFWFFLFRESRSSDFWLPFLAIFLGLTVDSQFINSLFYPPIMFVLYLYSGFLLSES